MLDPPATKSALAGEIWRQLLDVVEAGAEHRDRVLAAHDVTPNEARAVLALDAKAGRAMGALAAAWRCDPSYATSLVDRLETRGLVLRIEAPRDRRVKHAVLTPRGTALKRALARDLYRPPPELMKLSAAELEVLWHAAHKLRG
jgi:DNA-binding MarR family transcriptional regulator